MGGFYFDMHKLLYKAHGLERVVRRRSQGHSIITFINKDVKDAFTIKCIKCMYNVYTFLYVNYNFKILKPHPFWE